MGIRRESVREAYLYIRRRFSEGTNLGVEEHRTVRTICLQTCRRFSEIDANKEGDLNASIGMPYAPSIWSVSFLK